MSSTNNSPFVSVALPAVKSNFIRAAIDSIIQQTYENFELIIVDDSTDNEVKVIVDSFSDERIRYYTTNRSKTGKTQSPATTWNSCLKRAQGDYFILFADDDVCDPAFLEVMVQLTISHPEIKIFQCRFRIIDEGGNKIGSSPLCPDYESGLDFIFNHTLENRQIRSINYMVERKALAEQGGFMDLPAAWGSDVLTNYALSMKGGIVSTNKLLCDWRRSRFNITGSGELAEKLKAFDQHAEILNSILDSHVERSGNNVSNERLIHNIKRRFPDRIIRQKITLILSQIYQDDPGTGIVSKALTLKKEYQISFTSLIKLFLKRRFTTH